MDDGYLWARALHVLSFVSWMAGLLYLPRLYVYHCKQAVGSEASETFKVMERRLLRGIINPAMIATWIFGLTLVMTPGVVDWSAGWWHAKMFGFLAMSALHGYLAVQRKHFLADERRHSATFWRVVNEVPTVLLVLIVIMVIVRPF